MELNTKTAKGRPPWISFFFEGVPPAESTGDASRGWATRLAA